LIAAIEEASKTEATVAAKNDETADEREWTQMKLEKLV
jgi:hypothetical protein